jgi:DNA invertase Pin-like site-specific DNA recombinase
VIAQRTRDALASAKVHGTKSGNPIGRPRELDPKVRARLRRLRTKGWSYQRIAEHLNEQGVKPARGGERWYPSTVKAALDVSA